MLEAKHLLLIGRTAEYFNDGLTFLVTIINVKAAYGNVRAIIQPLHGSGRKTVNLDSLKIGELAKSY